MSKTSNVLNNNVLVATLNWGLGHATRCIPIIRSLLDLGFTPIIASDGMALLLLQKEFPKLKFLELPSYNIEYPVKELGVYSKKIPSVFITHQLNVLSGNTSWLTGKVQRLIIKKFNECWVPDCEEKPNLSGKLGHLKKTLDSIKYLGPLSRMTRRDTPQKYKLMVLLSGPEPQRSILEEILKNQLKNYSGNTIFVKGIVQEQSIVQQVGNCTYYNFLTSDELEEKMNESEMIVCRSGYTTIMDLAKLQKKALLIPTPGQYEQEYLAKRLFKQGRLLFVTQENFTLSDLEESQNFMGLPEINEEVNWKQLFCLFEGE